MEAGRDAARAIAARAVDDMVRGIRVYLDVSGRGAPAWAVARAQDLLEIAQGDWTSPSGLLLLRALREGVAELHGLAIDTADAAMPHLRRAHEAMDLAVSVSGGIADLVEDEDDWGVAVPEMRSDVPPFLLAAFDAMTPMARDLHDGVAAWIPLSTASRDAEIAVRLTLAVRSLLRSPDGVDAFLVGHACREGREAARRVQDTLASVGDPRGLSAVAGHVQDVFREAESALSDRISPTP